MCAGMKICNVSVCEGKCAGNGRRWQEALAIVSPVTPTPELPCAEKPSSVGGSQNPVRGVGQHAQ